MTNDVDRPGRLVAGAPIGGYHLLQVLGEGGMGVVWSARDPLLDRTLAIKVLKRSDAAPDLRKRLLREARAMARLKHPNVLTVYEVGTEGERDFIAMELVDGGSLDAWLALDPPRGDVIAAVLAAGRGLAAAHAAGLVHRDFKPHNILRGRDGRVLVTDFGLARGLAEESLPPAARPSAAIALDTTLEVTPTPAADSVLHSPLTQTGALIGTPAYMAPEQFSGSPPDPRTDQFAFCVTAWQALTGGRPHTGTTLEELRRAASAGVAHLDVALPRRLRAVLARGLDPDPAKRWPSLDALLDELERAQRPGRRRWPWLAAIGAAIALCAIAAIFAIVRRGDAPAAAAPVCEPAERAFAQVWSARQRDTLALDRAPAAFDRLAAGFDDYQRRWIEAYGQACRTGDAARIRCLAAVRDRVEVAVRAARDPRTVLPAPSACTVAPPALPDDPARRARAVAALARALLLAEAPDVAAEVEADARGADWPPVVPAILVAAGTGHLRRGDVASARQALRRAQPLAHDAKDARVEAEARLGLLEASLIELEEPGARVKKPHALHDELVRALWYARSAIRAAGDDPVLAGALALAEARATAALGRAEPRGKAARDARALFADARRRFEAAGDLAGAARAAAQHAAFELDTGALDEAVFAARSAEDALERAQLPREPALDEVRGRVAFARGELDDAHRRFDRTAAAPPAVDLPVHHGRVLDDRGAPRGGAVVVAWTGELRGDPVRVYTDPRAVPGEVVETAADGTFAIHAAPEAAIVAGAGDRRSTPQAIGPDPIVLRLGPPATLRGAIAGAPVPGITVVARYAAAHGAAWLVEAPVDRDGTYALGGLPRARYELATAGPAGDGTRFRTAATPQQLEWRAGATIDVIARGRARFAWVFTGSGAPRLLRDLPRTGDVASAALRPIGAGATDEGRELYEAGDRHAVLPGPASHDLLACIAATDRPDAPVACRRVSPRPAEGAVTPIVIPAP